MRMVILSLLAIWLTACGGGGGGGDGDGDFPPDNDLVILESISITPVVSKMALGTSLTLNATGIYSDQSSSDISQTVTWDVADKSVLQLDTSQGTGKIHAIDIGQSTISASLGDCQAVLEMTITPAVLEQLTLLPANATLPAGMQTNLSAIGVFSDGSRQDITNDISWQVTDTAIASVSNRTLTALSKGETHIEGSVGSLQATILLTVTDAVLNRIEISPSVVTVAAGLTARLKVTGIFSDATKQDITDQVSWLSSDEAVAQVSLENGRAILESNIPGTVTISARSGNLSASSAITVSQALLDQIEIGPASLEIAKGLIRQLTATGVYTDDGSSDITEQVLWTSSDESVIRVSNADGSKGTVYAGAKGTATVSAALNGQFASIAIVVGEELLQALTVSANFHTLPAGLIRHVKAHGIYSDHSIKEVTEDVVWTSSDTSIAVIDNGTDKGAVTGIAPGAVQISASLDGVTEGLSLVIDDSVLTSIDISPESASIPLGETMQFNATGIFSNQSIVDITQQVLWASSNQSVAVADNAGAASGIFQAVAQGAFTVTATLDGIEASVNAQVSDAVLTDLFINPSNLTLEKGLSASLEATGLYSDTSIRDLTGQVLWASADTEVAWTSNRAVDKGQVTAIKMGTTKISATIGNFEAVCDITITETQIASLTVTTATATLAQGTKIQLHASGAFNDGSDRDLTDAVLWESSDTAIAVISNIAGEKGQVHAISQGETIIKAYFKDQTATVSLTVTDAALVSMEVMPEQESLPTGMSLRYQAVGHFSDGSEQDLTQTALWQVNDRSMGTISNIVGLKGLFYAISPGVVTISADADGIWASTTLTITGERLSAVRILPTPAVLRMGSTLEVTFQGIFSDQSVVDLTSDVLWLSVDTQTATVSNAQGQEGLVTGLNTGQTYLLAIFGQLGFVKPVYVLSDFVMGFQQVEGGIQFVVYGEFGEDQHINLTEYVTWSSSDETILTVSDEAGEKGLAQVLQTGSVNITAYYNDDVTITQLLTITNN